MLQWVADARCQAERSSGLVSCYGDKTTILDTRYAYSIII